MRTRVWIYRSYTKALYFKVNNHLKGSAMMKKTDEFDILNLNSGRIAEDSSQWSLEHSFFSDFVFRSPKNIKSKEATDVLVWFDDVVLVVEVKHQEFDGDCLTWAEKNLKKAWRQVNGAARAIMENRVPYLENFRRGKISFTKSSFKNLYGLIILDHKCEPFNVEMFITNNDKIPIQVFSLDDLQNVTWHIDTAFDFITYFEARWMYRHNFELKVHDEIDFFSHYVKNLPEMLAECSRISGKGILASSFIPNQTTLKDSVTGNDEELKYGKMIDILINEAHNVDPNLKAIFPAELRQHYSPAAYADIATEFAKLSRIRRVILGKRFHEILTEAGRVGKNRHLSTHSPSRSTTILFLGSNAPRKERIRDLAALTELAKHYHRTIRAIGVATEPLPNEGRSFDFILAEHGLRNDKLADKLASEIFGGQREI